MSSESAPAGIISEQDDDRLARILDEYLVAIERGSSVTPDAFLARYPDDAQKLRGYLSGLQLFHAAIAIPHAATRRTGLEGQQVLKTIGDYRLMREIGRGGMGVVYEAWQVSLQRRVALKVLPFTAADDAKQISRFKNEAQAAAQVQHPNIVPVFAVGVNDGVHYYAMQLIEGESLTELLIKLRGKQKNTRDGTTVLNNTFTKPDNALVESARELDHADRFQLTFDVSQTPDHVRAVARYGVQAALALHAAHEYGVLHRDIKPSNLLLDDHGKIWITDFGLARFRDDRHLTQTGDVLGTMRYMSPEQARGRTTLIDHRTDVYSLGVTLYELATLHHPAEGVSDIQLYFEREYRAPKPLRQWIRHIPVDFQTIVLKAMGEFPQERYATAQDLADDLNRFLEGKPILASPPTTWARTNKWVRRHRRIVAAAAVLLVFASAAISLVLAHQKSVAERNLAQLLQSSRQTRKSLYRLSLLGEQLAPIPGADSVRLQLYEDLLGLYEQFQAQAPSNTDVAADIALAYSQSGSLFEKLNDNKRAIESYQAAMTLWKACIGREPSAGEYVRNLALCENNLALLLAGRGDFSQSLGLLNGALERQTELRSSDFGSSAVVVDIAKTHSNVGLVYSQLGQKQDAMRAFKTAIAMQEPLAQAPEANESVLRTLAACYNNLGSFFEKSQAAEAAAVYRKAITIQLRLVKTHPINRLYQGDLARTYNNLGYLAANVGDWQQAEQCYGDAIKLQEHLVKASPLAAAYRRDLAISYNNLGMVQSRRGRLSDAEMSFSMSIGLQELLLSADATDATTLSNQGSAFNNLGLLLTKQGRNSEAEAALQKAVLYQERAYKISPANHSIRGLLSRHYHQLAKNLAGQSKFEEANRISAKRKEFLGSAPKDVYFAPGHVSAPHNDVTNTVTVRNSPR